MVYPVLDCPMVQEMIQGVKITKNIATLVKDSFFCPKENGQIQICCPFDGIEPAPDRKPVIPDKDECGTQTGQPATCTVYNKCNPFLELLINLKKPIPPSLPKLMQGSWLCGFENVGGFNLPQICCPNDAIKKDKPSTTVVSTTTTQTTTTVTLEPEK